MVICYRKDLKMSKGKLAAQVAHGAVSCTLLAKSRTKKLFSDWYRDGQRKVVLKVEGKENLYIIQEQARFAGVLSTVVVDAGHTQLPPGTPTCVALGPDEEEKIDALTGHYPLG